MTKYAPLLIVPLAAMSLATAAYGQFDFGIGDPSSDPVVPAKPALPWASFHFNKKTRVRLDFRNATVDAVLHTLSQASGVPIIKDPSLTGGITLQSPKPQSLDDAFSMLNVVLGLKNYEVAHEGNFLIVQPKQAQRGGGRFGNGGTFNPGGGGPGGTGRGSQVLLQVYPLKYANATQLARVINEVFANSGTAQDQTQVQPGGGQPGIPVVVIPGQPAGGGRGGGRGGAAASVVKASADDFSNSLIVNAPRAQQDQVADIIKQIDKRTDVPQQSKVFKLQYALAADLQPVVQNILSATTPLGRGGSTSTPRPNVGGGGGGRFGFFQQLLGGSNSAGGSATADTRTNSIIVTAPQENLEHASQVINELDKPTTYQGTTFVYMMKNARADVVANLLNQSFGNRSSNGPVGGSLSGTSSYQNSTLGTTGSAGGSAQPRGLNSNTNTNNQRNNNQNQNNNFASGSSGLQSQGGSTTSLDEQGRVINVRNLTGQVLLVPNIDTNSIIVVAPPEDKAILQGILEQMDQIPEQVMIETLVVEANLSKTEQLGLEYNFDATNAFGIKNATSNGSTSFGLQGNTAQPQGLRYTLTLGQYQAFLQAVHTDTKFNVLSTPRIFTTNNAPAQINISQSLPYVTNQTVDTNGAIFYNYNFLDVGIVLTVTPRITSNGYVTMDVTQTANDFVGYTSFNAPIVNQREAQTTASVKDGETIVLGGIINNSISSTINKVPLLGDIPLIGNLFRSTNKTKTKTELLVFLTPHVVRDPDEARRLRNNTTKELDPSTQKMIPPSKLPPATSDILKPGLLVDGKPVNAPDAPPTPTVK